MTPQHLADYQRIEQAIAFLVDHWQQQPTLQQVAQCVNLSPQYLQRMFTAWAGVSPKKFVQFLSVEYAKSCLENSSKSLMSVAMEAGLSGTGRLHDLFVGVEAMTPGEYKNSGEGLQIKASIAETLFGKALVATTERGVCHIDFVRDTNTAMASLQQKYTNAQVTLATDERHQQVSTFLNQPHMGKPAEFKLHVMASPFQLKVWRALLSIPAGALATYSDIAEAIESPKASRAVGSAIARNPIAYLIPCHRVIRSTGNFGEYRWGASRKAALIGWEAAWINRHRDREHSEHLLEAAPLTDDVTASFSPVEE